MARTRRSETIGANASRAILAAGTDIGALTQATGLTSNDLESRLNGDVDFTWGELVEIGGLSHVPVSHLLEGAA